LDKDILIILRLEEDKFAAVIVESSWHDFMRYVYLETVAMTTALDESLLAFIMRYKTKWVFRPTIATAEKTALKLMIRFLSDRGVC